ncbi:MAG: hypothetical protein PW845_07985 [Pseudomonas sp.]|uniref:hypothetical protein n=1 Tax=Pseudomonas abieticivorans TaxID=2931382 RepID=UPI0020C17C20|nr:hypothetical protein [Pseudomonas sp. PIA16]MDE1165320.1 hypothetical protein [Pseudomonas sp.]
MHGNGLFGDLLHLGLYMVMIVAWTYLWLLCVFSPVGAYFKLLRFHPLMIPGVGIPAFAVLLTGDLMGVYDSTLLFWAQILLGVIVPCAAIAQLHRRVYRRRR